MLKSKRDEEVLVMPESSQNLQLRSQYLAYPKRSNHLNNTTSDFQQSKVTNPVEIQSPRQPASFIPTFFSS